MNDLNVLKVAKTHSSKFNLKLNQSPLIRLIMKKARTLFGIKVQYLLIPLVFLFLINFFVINFHYTSFYNNSSKANGTKNKFDLNMEGGSSRGFSVGELINGIEQDDPRVLDYIRAHILTPPSGAEYNLTNPDVDPGSSTGINAAVQRILGKMKGGFFVEAGAHNGEYISNTLSFERDFGWTGLLVEPSPVEYPNLVSKNRKSWTSNVCLSPLPLPSGIDFLHRVNYTIASKLGTAEEVGAYGDYWKVHRVTCFPIFSLLSALGVTTVDYFSLDVEGVELSVLKLIPFDKLLIKVFSIEYNLIPEGKDVLKKFMESKGYMFTEEVYHDYIFAHKSLNYKLPTTTTKPTTTKATTKAPTKTPITAKVDVKTKTTAKVPTSVSSTVPTPVSTASNQVPAPKNVTSAPEVPFYLQLANKTI